ncbi:MAG: aminotransferase class V-fold PLP-dependent enzyme [Eubacteriales bacterium]|nr:aminotransferase class V-fold PLP-dependent enzyme [Eubacteriales bacterium]
MIYFDNAAGTLPKPPAVRRAMDEALAGFGNPGRSFHEPAMRAARAVLAARTAVAALGGVDDPLRVAFTGSFTEAMSLEIAAYIRPGDRVAVDEAAHNSVLRPLYRAGAELEIAPCDALGRVRLDGLLDLIRPGTRAVFLCHGSNVTGNIADARAVYRRAQGVGALMVLDAAQTLGALPVSMDMADILCFTGHKALLGPQGTGGLIVREGIPTQVSKTGGTGSHTFEPLQAARMPDAFEAGTPGAHGLHALAAGIGCVAGIGLPELARRERALLNRLHSGIAALPNVRLAGDFAPDERLPILSFAVDGLDSAEMSFRLWSEFDIASRPGGHCAPLLHRRLGTVETGLTRLSLSFMNTADEVDACIAAVEAVARGAG